MILKTFLALPFYMSSDLLLPI